MKKALGLIETMGLTASITAADAAVKSANVVLLGRENTRGAGLTSIKFEGDVGAVKAAVDAGVMAASAVGEVVSAHVIPRPDDAIDNICVFNERMINGTSKAKPSPKAVKQAPAKAAKKPVNKKSSAPVKKQVKKSPSRKTNTKSSKSKGKK